MFSRKNKLSLTERELDILDVLWQADRSLTASEIANARPDLTMNTVQVMLRSLLKREFIKVAQIVYSGTVLARSYLPTFTRSELLTKQFAEEVDRLNLDISTTAFVSALLEKEQDKEKAIREIEQLETMLEEYKRNL